MKMYIFLIVLLGILIVVQGQNNRIRLALMNSGGDWLNDIDGDNIPGQAGVDYPVHASVPTDTSFRCSDYDYAGYFGDVEAGCQAYHVCFPDGRNASFLCVNGTVFHQRFYVCDWWFHFDCGQAINMYELNLFRKVPLPVLPPVQRRPFIRPTSPPKVESLPGPVPQPQAKLMSQNPSPAPQFRNNPGVRNSRPQQRNPKKLNLNNDSPENEKLQGKDKEVDIAKDFPYSGIRNKDRNPFLSNKHNSKDQCYCDCDSNRIETRLSPSVMYVGNEH